MGGASARKTGQTRRHVSVDIGHCLSYEAITSLMRVCSRGKPEYGAKAVPARGFAVRSRAASGPRSSGTMTGPRGTRCTGAGEGPSVCTRRFQETRPEVEPRGKRLGECRGGAPRGERVPLDARPRPKRLQTATPASVVRTHGTVAPTGAPPPFIFLEAEVVTGLAKLGRGCVARTRSLAPSAPSRQGVGAERRAEADDQPARVLDRSVDAAVDDDGLAGEVAGLRRAQIGAQIADIVRLSHAAHRNGFGEALK
jgi:hypothetical protein